MLGPITPTLEFLAFPADESIWPAQVLDRHQSTELDFDAQPRTSKNRIPSPSRHFSTARPNPRKQVHLVGGRQVGALSKTREAQHPHYGMAG